MKPEIVVTGVTNGQYSKTDIHINVGITDNSGSVEEQKIELDGQTKGTQFTVSSETPDPHILYIFARDASGNTADPVTISFVIDKTLPVIQPPVIGACVATPVSLDFGATDAHLDTVTATLNGAPVERGTIISQSGNYILLIKANDLAQNESTQQLSFIIDSVPPVIAVGAFPQYSNVPVTPSIEIIEQNPVRVTYKLDNSPYTPGTPISGEGQHVLEIYVKDCAGAEAAETLEINIDNTSPQVVITHPIDGLFTKLNVNDAQVQFTESSPYEVEYWLNGSRVPVDFEVSDEAKHTLLVKVIDAAANTGSATSEFTIDKTAPVVRIDSPQDAS
ncbi:hypothetical protein L0156_19035, partial [bacterium]|nr:hypothetical protein [bacterium]